MSDFGNKLAAIGLIGMGILFLKDVPLTDIFIGMTKGEIVITCLILFITYMWCAAQMCDLAAEIFCTVIRWLQKKENIQTIKLKITNAIKALES